MVSSTQAEENIKTFLASPAFGVIGASKDRSKFGNKVLRCYIAHHKTVYPVNPKESELEGLACLQQVADLPTAVASISIITSPSVTEKIVEQAIAKGIKNIWMQPGAESAAAIQKCEEQGVNVIAGGPCILVILGC